MEKSLEKYLFTYYMQQNVFLDVPISSYLKYIQLWSV